MRNSSRFAPIVLLLALAACVKDCEHNSAWLSITNKSGRHTRDFTLDYGQSAFKYEIFGPGITYGGYARISGRQTLSISYTDDAGVRQTQDAGMALSPDLIGATVNLTLRPDGTIGHEVHPRNGPPDELARLEDYMPWILGVLALFALPPLVLFLRKAKEAAATAMTRVNTFFSNPVLDATVAALGLVKKICPVPMFTMNNAHPQSWYEGTLDGRMVGLLEHGRLWVGGPDEATLCSFGRANAQAPFVSRDFAEREDIPILRDEEVARLLSGFSPATTSVGVLAAAVEATFDWTTATAEGLVSDAKLLSALRTKVDSFDPPLVRAVMLGDEKAVQALILAKADLEAMTLGYANAVTVAATDGKIEILRALLAAGASPKPEYGWPLFAAARAGHLEAVRVLLDAGLSVDYKDGADDTALISAVQGGQEEVVGFLLARGADVNARNKDGGTALGYADDEENKRVIEMLKAAGAQ